MNNSKKQQQMSNFANQTQNSSENVQIEEPQFQTHKKVKKTQDYSSQITPLFTRGLLMPSPQSQYIQLIESQSPYPARQVRNLQITKPIKSDPIQITHDHHLELHSNLLSPIDTLNLVNPGLSQQISQQIVKRTVCQCQKSQCLKRYCVCHSNGQVCDPKICKCISCENLTIRESTPNKKLDFCKCEGGCQQKYCSCFRENKKCNIKCKCKVNCKNFDLEVLQKKIDEIQKQIQQRIEPTMNNIDYFQQ